MYGYVPNLLAVRVRWSVGGMGKVVYCCATDRILYIYLPLFAHGVLSLIASVWKLEWRVLYVTLVD